MKKSTLLPLALTLGFMCTEQLVFGQNNTSQKLNQAYAWLKPVVHTILGILTIGMAVRVIYKMFFQQREAASEIVMFIIGLLFWALWTIFANDLLAIGGTNFQF